MLDAGCVHTARFRRREFRRATALVAADLGRRSALCERGISQCRRRWWARRCGQLASVRQADALDTDANWWGGGTPSADVP